MRTLVILVTLMAMLVISASAHSLWVETKDMAEVGDEQQIYVFYGHANSPGNFLLPLISESLLIKPDGTKMDVELAMETDKWIPGYGWVNYAVADVVVDQPGDYVFVAGKAPAVFDEHWFDPDAESAPFYFGQWATSVIHCGDGKATHNWTAGVPLEIIPDQAPYEIESEDDFSGVITYNGKPVSAMYFAYYWTWDVHSEKPDKPGEYNGYHWIFDTPAIGGFTEEDGKFTLNLNNSGQWIVGAYYEANESGEWTAKSDEDFLSFYKAGDEVPYEYVQFGSVLPVWVR